MDHLRASCGPVRGQLRVSFGSVVGWRLVVWGSVPDAPMFGGAFLHVWLPIFGTCIAAALTFRPQFLVRFGSVAPVPHSVPWVAYGGAPSRFRLRQVSA
jgi:hypothetical protein